MKSYVSAINLINFSNEVGNAIVHCEHAINQLELGKREHDFEAIWRDLFEVHFWDDEEIYSEAAKAVLEVLINSLCIAHKLPLVNEYDFNNDDGEFGEQLELDF